jgi:hypothetical protein
MFYMSTEKKPVVEWSFSFEDLGASISKQLRKMGIGDQEAKTEQFSAPLEDAASAHVELDLSVGQVKVSALPQSENLLEATVTFMGEMEFSVSGQLDKKVHLGQKNTGPGFTGPIKDAVSMVVNRPDLRWDVGLTPKIPLVLNVEAGLGETNLDLSGIQLAGLELDGGVGEIRLVLPAAEKRYSAEIDSGVGSIRVNIQAGALLDLDIDAGVGSTSVVIPQGAAVRVKAESGLGGIDLPTHFRRVKGSDDFITKSGVWETEGYALATQQISIAYSGGIGGLKIIQE